MVEAEAEAEFELVLKLLHYGIHLPWNSPMVGENQWTHLSPKWTITAKVYALSQGNVLELLCYTYRCLQLTLSLFSSKCFIRCVCTHSAQASICDTPGAVLRARCVLGEHPDSSGPFGAGTLLGRGLVADKSRMGTGAVKKRG